MSQKERLIELLEPFAEDGFDYYSKEDAAEYLLENDVIVPPCKVGDTVFVMYLNGYIKETRVFCFQLRDSGLLIGLTDGQNHQCTEFGKYLFLTREEAEAALKERL